MSSFFSFLFSPFSFLITLSPMFGFFKHMFGSSKPDPRRYEQEKAAARGADEKKRLSLAKNSKTHKEILYYLAEKDPSAKVREAVAKNKSMPVQVSAVLAGDKDEDVRLALAGRLVELLPELSHDRHSQLYAFAVQALGTLALDEVLKIRKALAETLKDHAHTPPKIAAQLARDIEREVAEPVLRFCAVLADGDLLDILKEHPAGWVVEAIAARPAVSGPVSEAVIETEHGPAGAILMQNEGAEITQTLLETIVERARNYPEWHEPLATRKNLPSGMAEVLAEFVDEKVRQLLERRGDFDKDTTADVTSAVRRRIQYEDDDSDPDEMPAQRARRLSKEGRLTDETVSDALAMRDKDFVIAALSVLLKTPEDTIRTVFAMHAPKPICAVAWKAGLSMRTALKLQQDIGKVPSGDLVYPKGGTDYPFTDEELEWQLDFLGLKAA